MSEIQLYAGPTFQLPDGHAIDLASKWHDCIWKMAATTRAITDNLNEALKGTRPNALPPVAKTRNEFALENVGHVLKRIERLQRFELTLPKKAR